MVPGPDSIRGALARVLSGKVLGASPQLGRLLRFIVEQELAGLGGELKEYNLGVQVFRKDASFDPRLDTVVRTEARRLRHKLAEYYQTEGSADPIEIALPKGSYRATFQSRGEPVPLVTSRRHLSLEVSAVLALAAAVAIYWLPARAQKRDPSLAVLPLENLSAVPDQEYFSDGLTDALITDLAKVPGWRVISRTSMLQFKKTRKPIPQIARELGVEYVVEGTVLRAGDRVRITAQLIAAHADRHLWAESYERAGGDILSLQAEIAQAIARQVHVKITPPEQPAAARTANLEAYDDYLMGRFYRNARKTDALRKSVEYFRQAIAKDQAYAPAWAGLSDAYNALAYRTDDKARKELRERARQAALKAIELAGDLAEAHVSLADTMDAWNWREAERELRRAIELSPGYAPAHQSYAGLLGKQGRFGEALAQIRRALELDPLAPGTNHDLGWLLYCQGRYDDAIRQLIRTTEVFPNMSQPYTSLGKAYLAKGTQGEAIAALQKAARLAADPTRVDALLAHARAKGGDRTEATRLLAKFQNRDDVSPYDLALLCLDVGDLDQAFGWLNQGVEQRANLLDMVKVEPMFAALHGDPRFPALLRKMNLPN